MKTVLSVFCCLCVVVLLTGCDNGDDGGSSGGYGEFPQASFAIITDADGNDRVECYNADSNVITNQQICIWNCANYNNKGAVRKVMLYFGETLVCEDQATSTSTSTTDEDGTTATDATTITTTCETKFALVKEDFDPCVL